MTEITFIDHVTEAVRSAMVGHAYRVLGDRRDAEDAVQRALVKLWTHWPQSDDATYLRHWMWQVMQHECIDEYRRTFRSWRRRVHGALPLSDGDRVRVIRDHAPTPEETVILTEEMAGRWATLDALPARHRAALLCFEECGSVRATAAAMGVAMGTVQSRVFRARAALRRGAGAPWAG